MINLLIAILLILGGRWMIAISRTHADVDRMLSRNLVARRDYAIQTEAFQWTQRQIETGVEDATNAAQSLHSSIANIPFDVLERIPITRHTSRIVRGVHDRGSEGIYQGIRTVNRALGKRLRRLRRKDDQDQ